MSTITIKKVKELIRRPYVWPGGYEVVFIANDGEYICYDCAHTEFKCICDSMKHDISDGWQIVGYCSIGNDCDYPSEENPMYCAHCNKDFSEDYK